MLYPEEGGELYNTCEILLCQRGGLIRLRVTGCKMLRTQHGYARIDSPVDGRDQPKLGRRLGLCRYVFAYVYCSG